MSRFERKIHVAFLIIGMSALFPRDAFAYLDPGTGSLVVQSLIAALAAAGYGIKLYWGKIRLWFRRPGHRED